MPNQTTKLTKVVSTAPPDPPAVPKNAIELQEQTQENLFDDQYPVQITVDTEIVYHVTLPYGVLKAILDPTVPDAFILLRNVTQTGPHIMAHGKYRYVHTSCIREITFDKDLPGVKL